METRKVKELLEVTESLSIRIRVQTKCSGYLLPIADALEAGLVEK